VSEHVSVDEEAAKAVHVVLRVVVAVSVDPSVLVPVALFVDEPVLDWVLVDVTDSDDAGAPVQVAVWVEVVV